MNTLRQFGPLDEPGAPDGDEFFTGVNERLAPLQLPPGVVARAVNKRFRNGKCEDRLGCRIMPWMTGNGRTPWAEIYGGAVFSDPNQAAEWFLIAADGGVWKTRPGLAATPVALPAGLTLTAATFAMFVQCFDVMLLLRGPDADPLVCTNLDEGFKAIVLTPDQALAGLRPIPRSSFGLCFVNRLFLIEGKDLLAVSDFLTYTAYLPATNTFRINSGSVDALVSLYPFGPSQLICFKDQSVSLLSNLTGDLSQVVQEEVTRKYGCGARLSVAASGTNVYWVSGEGRVRSLTLTQLNQTQDTDAALSDDLEMTLRRIFPSLIPGITAEIWNSRLYLAVPLDEARQTGPNVVPAGSIYGGHICPVPVIPGRTYRYTPGNSDELGNGGATLIGEQNFTAVTSPVILIRDAADNPAVTAEIALVYEGVNNGVLVHDFLTGQWCGSDESPGVTNVAQFFKASLDGRQRLFALTGDGFLRLYEEDFEDDVLLALDHPYYDILVNTLPAPGDTITLSGGAGTLTVTADPANTPTTWGCPDIDTARANLLLCYTGPGRVDGTATAIDWGIRVTDLIAAPVITGTWSFVDAHTGEEITPAPIASSLTTRGYVTVLPYQRPNQDRKRFLMLMPLLQTWNPDYTLSAVPNGVAMEAAYQTGVTRDRTKYEVQAQADWDTTNVNDDHPTPKRQDYSVVLPDTGFNLGASGVAFDLLQFSADRVPVSELGFFCQLKVENTRGRLELWGVLAEAQDHEHPSGISV